MTTVRLEGGPFDGRVRDVKHLARTLVQPFVDEGHNRRSAEWSDKWGLAHAMGHPTPAPPAFPEWVWELTFRDGEPIYVFRGTDGNDL